ncbi:hypothetical protein Acid345_0486 [Candidatus Koribacter versatilis Ellin345]|uniref:DUF3857 domain-containing protein n=1 Tax=Koribacter versatilis (strain Ellin345) TaxID=204669 RepID=Q1IUF9_KORVE|nr:hypothetical protein [Candidatus Koribacter versatilis]ABF39491.1 hypothetical protein Acid345_0486 [Candidatus Koribacter versatilis Ellin345]
MRTSILLLGLSLLAIPAFAGSAADLPKVEVLPTAAPKEPVYSVVAGIDGEIYPVFANYASLKNVSERKWGTIAVTVSNPTNTALRARISVQVQGWSDEEIQLAQLGAGASKTYVFAPTFLPRFYNNQEIAAATTVVNVSDMGGQTLYLQTVPVKIRSAEDMFWGSKFQFAPFIASWITPHDERVEEILRKAKEFMPGRRLPGYEPEKDAVGQEQMTYSEARAIYRALQDAGVSYVKSSMTLGGHQDASERVRMPESSLRDVSANCIDGVVMYASLFENLGMEPVVLLLPGHAYVGVRVSPKSDKYLYIETAITGRASFEDSIASAARGVASLKSNDQIRVSVADARTMGIFPMPRPIVQSAPSSESVSAALQLQIPATHQ